MKITVEEIVAVLKKEVETRIDYETLKSDIALTQQGMDSLDRLTFFLAVEEQFGLKIEESEMDKLQTIDDIIAFAETK